MNQEARLGYLIFNAARRHLTLEEEGELLRLAMLDPEVLDQIETEWLLRHVSKSRIVGKRPYKPKP